MVGAGSRGGGPGQGSGESSFNKDGVMEVDGSDGYTAL